MHKIFNPELFTEQIAGIVMVFTLEKRNVSFMIGKPNALRPSPKYDNTSARGRGRLQANQWLSHNYQCDVTPYIGDFYLMV